MNTAKIMLFTTYGILATPRFIGRNLSIINLMKSFKGVAREGAGVRGAEGSEWDWSAERLWKWLEHGVLKVKLGVGARSAFYPWPPPVFHVKMLGRS